jgi:phosphopantetheinyl transferase (holo-ACP synthase)
MTMVTGGDLVDIARLASAIERHPGLRDRVFTAQELADVHRDGVAMPVVVGAAPSDAGTPTNPGSLDDPTRP